MMLFQSELGLNVLDLLSRSADSVRWTLLQKQETKRVSGARLLPLRCLSQLLPVEDNINCLENEVLCICLRTFHLWGDMIFIMDDHDSFPYLIMILDSMFPSWMMTLNSMFHSLRIIQYFSQ